MEKEKHAGGRPTKYSEETLEKTREYIKISEDYFDEDRKKLVVKIPTIEGLALYLGITKETVFQWRKDEEKQEFSDLIDDLMKKQSSFLVQKGLSGDYNSVIAKVLLTKHGYREGTDVTTNDKEISITNVNSPALQKLTEEYEKKLLEELKESKI